MRIGKYPRMVCPAVDGSVHVVANTSDGPQHAANHRARTQIEASQAVGSYLLNVVDTLCTRLGIRFYLDAGTLLGAARNSGWISWDDDVDIMFSI